MPKTEPEPAVVAEHAVEPQGAPEPAVVAEHAVEPQGAPEPEDEAPHYDPRPYAEAITPEYRQTLVEAGLWRDENTPPQWDDPGAPPQPTA